MVQPPRNVCSGNRHESLETDPSENEATMTPSRDAAANAVNDTSDAVAFPPPAAPVVHSTLLESPAVPPRSKKPLVAAIVVAVLLLAGIGVFIATRSDDEKSSTATSSTLVRFNHDEEQLEVLDASGDVVDSFDVPDASEADFVSGLRGRVVFDASSNGEVVVMKVADGSVDRFDVPAELTLNRVLNADSTNLVLQSPAGGDVVVIDLESGDTTSALEEVGDGDSKFFPGRRFESGSTYSDVGGKTTQTLVVPNVGSDVWAVPGFVAALDGERVLTVEPDDDAATVSIYERDKKVGSVDVDGSVLGGLLTGDETAIVVTAEGDIVKVDVGSEDATDVGTLADPIRGSIVLRADRLLVVGDGTSSYLLDAAGKTLAEFEPVDDGDGDPQSVELGPSGFRPGAQCFAIQPGSEPRPDGGDVTLRDLDTGDVLTELDSSAAVVEGYPGCVAVTPFDATADVYFDGEVHEYDGYANVLAVSHDLDQVVVSGADGFALVAVASGDETDLDRYQYAFVTG